MRSVDDEVAFVARADELGTQAVACEGLVKHQPFAVVELHAVMGLTLHQGACERSLGFLSHLVTASVFEARRIEAQRFVLARLEPKFHSREMFEREKESAVVGGEIVCVGP